MTVTNVMGCGTQKGETGQYRCIEMSMNLTPKLQVDIVVSKVDQELWWLRQTLHCTPGKPVTGDLYL